MGGGVMVNGCVTSGTDGAAHSSRCLSCTAADGAAVLLLLLPCSGEGGEKPAFSETPDLSYVLGREKDKEKRETFQ